MLDKNQLTGNFEDYAARLAHRKGVPDLEPIKSLNARRKELQKQRDDNKSEQTQLSKQIGPMIGQGKDPTELKAQVSALKETGKGMEAELAQVNTDLDAQLMMIPNLPHPKAPLGGEEDGVVARTEGERKTFAFAPKDHVAICDATGLVEFGDQATRLAGSSFVVYRGQGARLVRALINFFLDLHTTEHGYTEVSVPFLVNTKTITGTGQLPKFADDLYQLPNDDLWLIPTAEVPVTNLHQDSILSAEDLPLSYCAYTPCFRREAGAAGKMTRGLKRLHQFDKVELVRFCLPEESDAQHQLLLQHAEEPLKRLGLHYRIKELAAGDISFAAARCFDIETHAPASDEWLEVSSVSTFTDFQARRAGIKAKGKKAEGKKKNKPFFVHTLNGSGLALPRVVVTLLETYQREDGGITVPDVLRPYMGGQEVIGV